MQTATFSLALTGNNRQSDFDSEYVINHKEKLLRFTTYIQQGNIKITITRHNYKKITNDSN